VSNVNPTSSLCEMNMKLNQMMVHGIYRHVKYFERMNLTIYMRELNSAHGADTKYMGKYFTCDRLLPNYHVYKLAY